MKNAAGCIFALLVSVPCGASPQSLKSDTRVAEAIHLLDVWIDAEQAYHQIPGVSVAIVHDQELLWSRGFGYADVERSTPASATTLYSICSISKLFTSIGVMQQRDSGKLRLDDAVGDHLPWFTIEQTHPGAPPVTLRGILTHSSGLPREADFPYWSGPDFEFPTREQIQARIGSQSTLYPADRYFQYSNLGLTLAGEVVAQVADQPYGEYIRQHILDPLGMTDTHPEIPTNYAGGKMATGYGALTRDGERQAIPLFQARGIAPAAGFASTVEDLARFASWQFRLLENGGQEILDANTLREMHRVHWVDPNWETTWGLGFSVQRSDDKTFVGHGGSCPGYRSHLRLRSSDKIGVILMTNTLGVSPGSYTQRGYEAIAPAIAKALDSLNVGPSPDQTLAQYTGKYGASFGGEIEVLPWDGDLALLYLPTDNPLDALTKLRHTGDHTFRRVRDNGELGEEIVFELDEDGQVARLVRHSNHYPRIKATRETQ